MFKTDQRIYTRSGVSGMASGKFHFISCRFFIDQLLSLSECLYIKKKKNSLLQYLKSCTTQGSNALNSTMYLTSDHSFVRSMFCTDKYLAGYRRVQQHMLSSYVQ